MGRVQPYLIPVPSSSSPAFRVFKYGSLGPLTKRQQEAVQPIVDFVMNNNPGDEASAAVEPAELSTADTD